MIVSDTEIASALREARAAACVFRLPFRHERWRGTIGNWSGAGVGTSIDFHDHRPYLPGDDPRFIDWQAYARSDAYVMKLYREEVAPVVDLVFDTSSSMGMEPAKKLCGLALFYFIAEAALAMGAGLRPWLLGADGAERVDIEGMDGLHRGALFDRGDVVDPSALGRVAYRSGSIRVLVSDGLFREGPDGILSSLLSTKGRAVVLAPRAKSESDPDWSGRLELEDCESGVRRVEYLDSMKLEAYRAAYARHFQLWEAGCRRRAVPFAQIPAEQSLIVALRARALSVGAVEPAA